MSTSLSIKIITTAVTMQTRQVHACNTEASVASVVDDLNTMFADKEGHAAGTIRLAFHDAGTYKPDDPKVGGPTGCLAEDPDNAGLKRITDALEIVLGKHKETCTRADLWYLATFAAADSLVVAPMEKTFLSAYTWGRVNEDIGQCQYKEHRLPAHQLNCKDSFAIMTRPGFSAQEVAALLGAHSVGRAHEKNSGFKFSWDTTPKILDNKYYETLLDDEWGRVKNIAVTSKETAIGDRFWIKFIPAEGVKKILMLNVDMCMGFEIGENDKDTPETAKMSCQVNWHPRSFGNGDLTAVAPEGSAKTCPNQKEFDTRKWTRTYKNNQKLFLTDFRKVMKKLSELGHEKGASDKRGYALCAPCKDAAQCCCGPDCKVVAPTKTVAPSEDSASSVVTFEPEEPETPSPTIGKAELKIVKELDVKAKEKEVSKKAELKVPSTAAFNGVCKLCLMASVVSMAFLTLL